MKEEYLNRLIQSIAYLKDHGKARTHKEIAATINKTRPNVSAAIKGNPRYLTRGFLKRFAAAYKDYIKEEWLLDGVGEMVVPDVRLHPFFESKAAAGFLSGDSLQEKGENLRELDSFLPFYNFMIEVDGRSMEPLIFPGDILICRQLVDSLNPPIGKICVIDTNDAPIVKEVTGYDEEALLAHSLNLEYPDLRIEFSSINGIALVVGSLRTQQAFS